MAIETEVKLRVRAAQTGELRARIAHLGYTAGPRVLERDQLYDRADGSLRAEGKVLRLRQAGDRAIITCKGPAASGPHKSREEIETHVADPAALETILFSLGFVRGFRYEKYRTTFRSGFEPGLITFDETPAGEFLELEGPADWIDATAVELGYSAADYITDSYAKLWLLHTGEAVLSNMVF